MPARLRVWHGRVMRSLRARLRSVALSFPSPASLWNVGTLVVCVVVVVCVRSTSVVGMTRGASLGLGHVVLLTLEEEWSCGNGEDFLHH